MHLPTIVNSSFVYTYLAIKLDSDSASSKRIACLALFPGRYSKTSFGYFILSSRGSPHQLCLVPVSETTLTGTPPCCSTRAWRPPGRLFSLLQSPQWPSRIWLRSLVLSQRLAWPCSPHPRGPSVRYVAGQPEH